VHGAADQQEDNNVVLRFRPNTASSSVLDRLAALESRWKLPRESRLNDLAEVATTLPAAAPDPWTALGPDTLMYVGYSYAAMVILGGMMGFAKAKSKASLIAGSLCGISIGAATYLKNDEALFGLSLVFVFFFGIKFVKTGKVMPGGMFTLLSIAVAGITAWSQYQVGVLVLPPQYLSVKGFQSCLQLKNNGSWQSWCMPASKPEKCLDASWAELSSQDDLSKCD